MIIVEGTRSEKSLLELLNLNKKLVNKMKADELKSICFALGIEYTNVSGTKTTLIEMIDELPEQENEEETDEENEEENNVETD